MNDGDRSGFGGGGFSGGGGGFSGGGGGFSGDQRLDGGFTYGGGFSNATTGTHTKVHGFNTNVHHSSHGVNPSPFFSTTSGNVTNATRPYVGVHRPNLICENGKLKYPVCFISCLCFALIMGAAVIAIPVVIMTMTADDDDQ